MANKNPILWPEERKAALKRGEPYYFTGVPCANGHIFKRMTNTAICIACRREWGRRYHIEHPERSTAKAKKRYAAKSDVIRQGRRDWYAKPENKEKAKETRRLYMLKKGDEVLAKARSNAANYRAKFPDKAKQAIDNWWDKNPGRKNTYARNRRAMKRGNGGAHTQADVESIFRAQKGRCAYCRKPLPKEGNERHVDHIVPLIKGGTNDRRNLQILCQPCNLEKGRRDPLDHARKLGMLL